MKIAKKVLSVILVITMLITTFVGVFPPIEVNAVGATIPSVETNEAEINGNTVTMSGMLTANGGETITEYGFGYCINDGADKFKKYYGSLSKGKTVEYELDLEPGDYGWYYFYAKNSAGKSNMDSVEFEIPEVSAPEVTTFDAEIDGNTVIMRGEVDWNGDATITEYGFGYCINNGTNQFKKYTKSLSENETVEFLLELESGDRGWYYFYAKNSAGKSNMDSVEFEVSGATKVVAPAVTTLDARVSGTSVTLVGRLDDNGNGTITEYGFSYQIGDGEVQYKKYGGSIDEGQTVEFTITVPTGASGWYYFYAKNTASKSNMDSVEFVGEAEHILIALAIFEPETMTYTIGDMLIIDELVLLAVYSDGTNEIIKDGFSCTPMQFTQPGYQEVIVQYGGLSVSYYVWVNEDADIPNITLPLVTTFEAKLTEERVTLVGRLDDNGNGTITEYGFSYQIGSGEVQYKKYGGSIDEGQTVEFTITVPTGASGWYYFYAKNSAGKSNMDSVTFEIPAAAADKEKPVINPIKLSASKITETTEITISTEASDNIGLKLLTIYIDDIKVKELASKGTTATISYSKSGFAVGKHTVKVVAVDQSGNENFVTTTFEVEKKQGGQIYDITLSSYNFRAGTTITFTVTTSTDTEKLRMSSGNYYFPEITDSKIEGSKKVWIFDQYVATAGVDRSLTIETYAGGWTGNIRSVTFTVTPSDMTLGTIKILNPTPGKIHALNQTLVIEWSATDVAPDRYIVNITGVDSAYITIDGTKATVSSDAFAKPGTYAISVTAQKTGYNQSVAYSSILIECIHKNVVLHMENTIGLPDNVDSNNHKITVVPEFRCTDCGVVFDDITKAETKYEPHYRISDDFVSMCPCGYVFEGRFEAYTAYLQSDVNQPTYADPDLTVNHGIVYPSDKITVIGATENAYLIEYSLDNGGTKTGYISKVYIDVTKYDKGARTEIKVNGTVVSAVRNNGKIYVNINELIAAMGSDNASISYQGDYVCQINVRNTSTDAWYSMAIDLSDYKNHNWTNVYATSVKAKSLVSGFCIGAYLYGGKILVELQELMDFLEYQQIGNVYTPNNLQVDYELYRLTADILNSGSEFYTQYDAIEQGGIPVAIAAVIHAIAYDQGKLVEYADSYTYESELIEVITQTIFEQSLANMEIQEDESYTHKVELALKKFAAELFLDDNLTISVERLVELSGLKGEGEFIDSIFGTSRNVSSKILSVFSTILDGKELLDFNAQELLLYTTLCDKYEENIRIIDQMIESETDTNLIRLYKLVKVKIENSFEKNIEQYLTPECLGSLLKFVTSTLKTWVPIAIGGGVGLTVSIVMGVGDITNTLLQGNEMMSAFDGILYIAASLQALEPSLENAMDGYLQNPNEENQTKLVQVALYVAKLKVRGDQYCYDYVTHSASKMLWEKLLGTLDEYGGMLERAEAYWSEKLEIEEMVRKLEAWKE